VDSRRVFHIAKNDFTAHIIIGIGIGIIAAGL
jgi:hypothetical protein